MRKLTYIFLVLICILCILILLFRNSIHFTKNNFNSIPYQVGIIKDNKEFLINSIIQSDPGRFGKYIVNLIDNDSFYKFHCLIPIFEIKDNSETIWSRLFHIYYFEFNAVFVSVKCDTITKILDIPIDRKGNKLFINLNYDKLKNKPIQICDPRYLKPCMINKIQNAH